MHQRTHVRVCVYACMCMHISSLQEEADGAEEKRLVAQGRDQIYPSLVDPVHSLGNCFVACTHALLHLFSPHLPYSLYDHWCRSTLPPKESGGVGAGGGKRNLSLKEVDRRKGVENKGRIQFLRVLNDSRWNIAGIDRGWERKGEHVGVKQGEVID